MRVAYEALSWGRHAHQLAHAWSIVERAPITPTSGLCVDSFHALANEGAVDTLDVIDPPRSSSSSYPTSCGSGSTAARSASRRRATCACSPGEGVHNDLVAELVRRLQRRGYAGDYSFEVFNDDYGQMPLASVCERAMRSVHWIAGRVARRSLPVLREV